MHPIQPDPFEPSDTPRPFTPLEIALVVKICRLMRGWSQENLAEAASVTVRTVQRVEAGHQSDTITRRGLARAFGADDIDLFNKPTTFFSQEQMAEKRQKEDEERSRHSLELPLQEMDGAALIELTASVGAFTFGVMPDFKLCEEACDIWAELQDYMQDSNLIAADLRATERRELAKGVQDLLKKLASLAVSVRVAERETVLLLRGEQRLPLKIGYFLACRRGDEPGTVWVPRKLDR